MLLPLFIVLQSWLNFFSVLIVNALWTYSIALLYLQYPKEPPHIYAVESKGLDEDRQSYLIRSIQNKAKELSNYPMLVTLCEVFSVIFFLYSTDNGLFIIS
jgi:hypothetical protein